MLKPKLFSAIAIPQTVLSFMAVTVTVAALGSAVVLQNTPLIADLRNNACVSCGGGTCPDGFSYGPDSCAPQASCQQRAEEACRNHGGGTGTGGGATSPSGSTAPAPGKCDSSAATARACRDQPFGTRIGGTCTCRQTTGTICGCMAEGIKCENNNGTCLKPDGKSCNQHGRAGSPGGECTEGMICCGARLDGSGDTRGPTPSDKVTKPPKPTPTPSPKAKAPLDKQKPTPEPEATSPCVVGRLYCRQGDIMLCAGSNGRYKLDEECSYGCFNNPVRCKTSRTETTGSPVGGSLGGTQITCVSVGRQATIDDKCCAGTTKCPVAPGVYACRSGTVCEGSLVKLNDGYCSNTMTGNGREGCHSGQATFDETCPNKYRCGVNPTQTTLNGNTTQVADNVCSQTKNNFGRSGCKSGNAHDDTSCSTGYRCGLGAIGVKEGKEEIAPRVSTLCYGAYPTCSTSRVDGTVCPQGTGKVQSLQCWEITTSEASDLIPGGTDTCYAANPCRVYTGFVEGCPASYGWYSTLPKECLHQTVTNESPEDFGFPGGRATCYSTYPSCQITKSFAEGCPASQGWYSTRPAACSQEIAKPQVEVTITDKSKQQIQPPNSNSSNPLNTCVDTCIRGNSSIDTCVAMCDAQLPNSQIPPEYNESSGDTLDVPRSGGRITACKDIAVRSICQEWGCEYTDAGCVPRTIVANTNTNSQPTQEQITATLPGCAEVNEPRPGLNCRIVAAPETESDLGPLLQNLANSKPARDIITNANPGSALVGALSSSLERTVTVIKVFNLDRYYDAVLNSFRSTGNQLFRK